MEENYALTGEQLDYYRDNGHVFLRNVASADELAIYEPIISDWVFKLNYHDKPVSERDTYGKAFIQIGNLWQKSAETARFSLAKRFAKIAADLMGVDGVRIYHDQALFKEPGGGHTPWHQDQTYWPLDTDKTITMWWRRAAPTAKSPDNCRSERARSATRCLSCRMSWSCGTEHNRPS